MDTGVGLESALGQSRRPRTLLSSIDGFSRPNSNRIHSLEDLLRYVQSLGLEMFVSSQIEITNLLGQGVSYKVFGCIDRRTGSAVAVKRVKLPSSSTNFEAFEHRVACVLRDIEVMHHPPLAEHANIIKLLGYGWDYEQGDTIPYLVTELAEEGSLRQYLSNSDGTSIYHRLELCGDIISGLYEIHLCGVCHGDVKLDNVLVSPQALASSSKGSWSDRSERPENRKGRAIAKISDFGHSIMLSSDEASVSQYRGTTGYAAPETYTSDIKYQAVDIRKCDLWALGLACWETLAEGVPYYEIPIVQEALSSTISSSTSPDLSGTTFRSRESGTDSTLRNIKRLYELTDQFSLLARRFTARSIFKHHQQAMSNSFWSGLLARDPFKRSALVIHLPLFYEDCIPKITSSRQQLVPKTATEREWSFEIFRPSRTSATPNSAKQKIFQDFQILVGHKDPLQACRANLHVAYSYATGFGVKKNMIDFLVTVQKCTDEGIPVVISMKKLLKDSNRYVFQESSIDFYASSIRTFLKQLVPIPMLNVIGKDSSYESLEIAAGKAAQALGVAVIPTAIFAVWHNLTKQIPYGAQINEQHPTSGETPLATACRLGNFRATMDLLDRGADPSIPDDYGCLPLHWLCMFDNTHIELVTLRLTQDWGSQNINCRSNTPRVPDVQFPTVLHGTAIAFAVTTCSIQAVKALLAAGADVTCGYPEAEDLDWGDRSAVTIAVRLHLFEMLEILLPTSALDLRLLRLPCALPKASIIERYLIHGFHCESALRNTMIFLSSHWPSSQPPSYAPIEAALEVMDLKIAEALLSVYYNYSQIAKDHLFRICIEIACGGTLDWNKSTSMLDFAFSQGCDINATFPPFGRAIDMLISRQQGKLLQDWLLCRNPLMDQIYLADRSFNPLYDLIDNGLSDVVPIEDLLSRGANPNSPKHEKGHTALHLAVERHKINDVKSLLKYGADPVALDHDSTTPFHSAVRDSNIAMLKEILPFVKDVNITGTDGKPALFIAAASNLTETTNLLLQYASPSRVSDILHPALHVAALFGYYGPLDAIVKSGHDHDVNSKDADGHTPLLLAIQSHSRPHSRAYSCAISLLEAGADPNARNNDLTWPVHMVMRHFNGPGRLELMQKLRQFGARLDVCRSDGISLLHLAASMHDTTMVQYLLDAGIPPACLDNHSQTPLHVCVRSTPIMGHIFPISDVENACHTVKIIANAGRDVPFKPHARDLPITEAQQDFDPAPVTEIPSQRITALAKKRMETMLKRWQEKRAAENRERENKKANWIAGFSITLFRDEAARTALELAVLRKSDQEVLKCLLRTHQDHLQEQDGTRPQETLEDGEPRGPAVDNRIVHHSVIDAGWAMAVGTENWPAVKQFLINKAPVNLEFLRWPKGASLLEYSIEKNDLELLKLFMGEDVALDIHQNLPTMRSGWPEFPRLSREFSVDLVYLWEITRKVRQRWVLPDEDERTTKKSGRKGRMNPDNPDESHMYSIPIDHIGRRKAREKWYKKLDVSDQYPSTSEGYLKAGTLTASSNENTLVQIWKQVQAMDLQTANFYFASIRHDPAGKFNPRNELRQSSPEMQKRLLELLSLASDSSSQITRDAHAQTQSCAPAKTSIPLSLIHDLEADDSPNSSRIQKLKGIEEDFRDLLTVMSFMVSMNHIVTFESIHLEEWFRKTWICFTRLWEWLREVYAIELEKWAPSTRDEDADTDTNADAETGTIDRTASVADDDADADADDTDASTSSVEELVLDRPSVPKIVSTTEE